MLMMPMRFLWGVCCCFHLSVSHHIVTASVVFHQTHCTTTDRATTINPSFKALLSCPHFPSLPTSSGEELLPIHVSFVVTQFDWSLVGGRDAPNLPASTSCAQSTSSSLTSLSNEVLLFLIKTSFMSCPHLCFLEPSQSPRTLKGR